MSLATLDNRKTNFRVAGIVISWAALGPNIITNFPSGLSTIASTPTPGIKYPSAACSYAASACARNTALVCSIVVSDF